jgi:hypothetical protein
LQSIGGALEFFCMIFLQEKLLLGVRKAKFFTVIVLQLSLINCKYLYESLLLDEVCLNDIESSSEFKDLIKKLLVKNPNERLGFRGVKMNNSLVRGGEKP